MNTYTDEAVSAVLRAFGAYLAAGDRPLTRNQRADVDAAFRALPTRTPEMTTEVLERAIRARDDELDRGLQIVETAKAANRALSETEEAELAAIKDHAEETNARIRRMDQLEHDKADAARFRAPYEAILGREESRSYSGGGHHVYRPGGEHSFFADVYASSRGDGAAIERLTRNEKFASETRSDAGGEYRAGTTGSTSFGAFIPPVWLLDQIANKARAGRVVPDLIGSSGPPTSNSMVVPRVTTGTLTAIQATENTDLGAVDFVTLSLTRPTSTIGGYVDASLQSLELGDFATDRMVFGDLIADYNRAVDSQCIIGTGASAQLLGLDALTGLNVQTWTQATPTVALLYSQVAQAISSVWTGRFDAPDAILMAPRRWAWILAASDTTGRPLVVSDGSGTNQSGTLDNVGLGRVGTMQNLPVYTSANVPSTVNATQDEVYVAKFSDMLFYESEPRAEIFRDVGSATGTVRFRIYSFCNLFVGRYPAGVTRITGSGLTTPVFP